MTLLRTRGKAIGVEHILVGRVEHSDEGIYLRNEQQSADPVAFLSEASEKEVAMPAIIGVRNLNHLDEGDIVLVDGRGSVQSLFRGNSFHNSLFITDRCNSNCLMCSQPPKDKEDLDHYYGINNQVIDLMPQTVQELGITGGEPTLLGERFPMLLNKLKVQLPETDVHVLTNGRSFAWKNVVDGISQIEHYKTVYGVPLYSDYAPLHDYIVQAKDAFNQTVIGLHNAARYGLRLEVRVVLHKQTYKRLPALARFIYQNLPFVEHIAFMGLEYTGYTPYNTEKLFINPDEYANELAEAVEYLSSFGMHVSIYNLQHCLLPERLWKFTRNSISDWKRGYLDECANCSQLESCGGVFTTSKQHSANIKAIASV
ncbi:His-Xaa-Ser system radical SAM maturase HxsC [Persicobacter diffluens]|uniref:His-Xaa-Ser system radical SAM maturase HxsC n=1 Tax=Persicobacter diffluens TaxID=981 RepID=A0AAN5AMD4_9BACT|nr:His-Xaa-Ser system radical SAM maturase HxsC [Persicobacter diffluens]